MKTIKDEPSLFPNDPALKEKDKVRRDELNLALTPMVHFPGKRSKGPLYELIIKFDNERHVKLISSKAGGGIPEGPDLDYLYGMMDILYDQTEFTDDTIYFLITELITKVGRSISQQEIERAVRAIRRYRHLVIQSNALKIADDHGKVAYSEIRELSYIQEFHIMGAAGTFKRGRRKKSDIDGQCMVVFSKYFMQNIINDQVSKPLNYSLMMKLSNPKAKKLFRLIDALRYIDGHIGDNHHEIVTKAILELAKSIPLSDYELQFVSRIKRSLEPIHEELKALQYISDYYYQEVANIEEIVYVFSKFKTDQASAYNELIINGISAKAAEEMALTYRPEKIFDCIKYCHYKKEEKKKDGGDVGPGYIRTTIIDSNHDSIKAFLDRKKEEEKQERRKNDFATRQKIKGFYDLYIEKEIDSILSTLDEKELGALRENAEKELRELGSGIRFTKSSTKEAAIQGHIRSALKEKVVLPSFEDWMKKNKDKYADVL